ncbi:hypothetical protein [Photobacterium phosphoreum]|uniref:hypothetical protein n=1 Tax=Photobacterium phosphoreum TaxID=659 RepID=UPI001E4A00EE|nr:hypothetical protein [Photobacterium phosphoreum]MCD9471326.1 hypothetical protein [Photobacterium phosphoreum]
MKQKNIKYYTLAILSTSLIGCANFTPVAEEDLPKNATYEMYPNTSNKLLIEYFVTRKVELKQPLEYCLSSSVKNTDVSFDSTTYTVGAFTGNLYSKKNNSKTEAKKQIQTHSNISLTQEQISNAFVTGGFISMNMKHDIAAKYENGTLKLKFFNLNSEQANTGSMKNTGFKDRGIVTWMSETFNGSVSQYEKTASKIVSCLSGSF